MKTVKLEKRFVRIGGAFFLAGAVLGFWVLNFKGKELSGGNGIMSEYFIRQYKYFSIDGQELFYYILEHRMKWMVLLWGLGWTSAGKASVCLWCGWLGVLGGILGGMSVARFGILGLLFCIAAMIPQILFYAPAWLGIMNKIWKRAGNSGGQKRIRSVKNLDWTYIAALAVGIFVFLLGILTESYVNPWLMKQILKFF